jgi:hypothetical protein
MIANDTLAPDVAASKPRFADAGAMQEKRCADLSMAGPSTA